MPPKEFLDWLDAHYTWTEANEWRMRYTSNIGGMLTNWENDKVYQYWMNNVSGQEADWEQQYQAGTVDLDALWEALNELYTNNVIDEKKVNQLYQELGYNPDWQTELYTKYPGVKIGGQDYLDYLGATPEIRAELESWNTGAELADKLNLLDIDQQTKANLYDVLYGQESTGGRALRSAEGRALTEQEKAQVDRQERATDLTGALNQIYNNPLTTEEDLKQLGGGEAKKYIEGESDKIITRIQALNQNLAVREANQTAYGLGQEQQALAQIRGMRQPVEQKEWQRPPIPSEQKVAESYLRGTNLPKGSRLRSFIESEIPGIAAEKRAARGAWWTSENPNPYEGSTFEGEKQRMKGEAAQWLDIARNAPTATTAGTTYFGEGGLAGIARGAYERSIQGLLGLTPGQFGTAPKGGKFPAYKGALPTRGGADPLQEALRQRNWLSQYYRRAGTGLFPSLTPSVRYR